MHSTALAPLFNLRSDIADAVKRGHQLELQLADEHTDEAPRRPGVLQLIDLMSGSPITITTSGERADDDSGGGDAMACVESAKMCIVDTNDNKISNEEDVLQRNVNKEKDDLAVFVDNQKIANLIEKETTKTRQVESNQKFKVSSFFILKGFVFCFAQTYNIQCFSFKSKSQSNSKTNQLQWN